MLRSIIGIIKRDTRGLDYGSTLEPMDPNASQPLGFRVWGLGYRA